MATRDTQRCMECYHTQPGYARFCNMCGADLVNADPIFTPPARSSRVIPTTIVITILVALGVAAVITRQPSPPPVDKSLTTTASTVLPSVTAELASLEKRPSFEARVTGITDGDTVRVLDGDNRTHVVRLEGIDAPEAGQEFNRKAKEHLSDLIWDKNVTVLGDKIDKHGRLVAKMICDGLDVNLEQIRAGFAWHFKKYEAEQTAEDRKLYAEAEITARAARTGLWAGPNPIAPWNFRAGESVDPALKDKIVGNLNSMIYHWSGCPGFNKIAAKNRVVFETWEEAEEAGYRAATNCSAPKPEAPDEDEVYGQDTSARSTEIEGSSPSYYYTPPIVIRSSTPQPMTVEQPSRSYPSYSESRSYSTTPTYAPAPSLPSYSSSIPKAICADGTYSYSQNDQGTCSHHGGVSTWLNDTPNAERSARPSSSYSRQSTDATYRPKTVFVRGYVKRDGTYVAPYMRSAPRRRN